MVQHLSMLDYVAVSGSWEDRVIEHVDHLHEHFVTPVHLEYGRYRAPLAAGGGGEMLADSVAQYSYPDGPIWAARRQ
jgi:L-fuconate dehydratase